MATDYDVLVIGEGVAGLTAAGELARAGLKVATLEAQLFGGLVINVNELDPPPEGSEGGSGNSGAEYASTLMQTARRCGPATPNGCGGFIPTEMAETGRMKRHSGGR